MSVRKTPQEKAHDAEKNRMLQRKVERSKLLMEKLMIAQKRGEDISKYVEQAQRNSTEGGDEKVEEEACEKECATPRAIRIRSPGAKVIDFGVCLDFKVPSLEETDLQFYLEMDLGADVEAYTGWDLPVSSVIASEGLRIEACLNEPP